MKAVVALYEYPNGATIRVFSSKEKAEAWGNEIAHREWETVCDSGYRPDQPMVEYFERCSDLELGEYFSFEEYDIE